MPFGIDFCPRKLGARQRSSRFFVLRSAAGSISSPCTPAPLDNICNADIKLIILIIHHITSITAATINHEVLHDIPPLLHHPIIESIHHPLSPPPHTNFTSTCLLSIFWIFHYQERSSQRFWRCGTIRCPSRWRQGRTGRGGVGRMWCTESWDGVVSCHSDARGTVSNLLSSLSWY